MGYLQVDCTRDTKQQALIELVQEQSGASTQHIVTAIKTVADRYSLDVVIDQAAVFVGNLSERDDLTQKIINELAAPRSVNK
jgi:Skp family chaperone for outer membrane proteins